MGETMSASTKASALVFNASPPSSSFANIFRLELLNKYGGWWFDADCICIKNVQDFINFNYEDSWLIWHNFFTG